MTQNKTKTIIFLDTLGRTIIGVGNDKESTALHLAVDNPAVLNIVPTQQGSMQVQIIPLIFREILASKEEAVTVFYQRNLIAETSQNTVLNHQIIGSYQNVTAPTPQATSVPQAAANAESDKVIKLFDD